MTVFVTGGAGYIGSHTCLELLRQGHEVVVADNLCNASPLALERVQELAGRSLRFYRGDVRDGTLLDQIFRENDIGCVIHFAGLKAVGESVAQPGRYYDNNLNSTLSLTRAMERAGVKNLIFSSSATVYQAGSPMPLKETSPTGGCTNPYGWSKFMSEQILRDLSRADEGWSIALLRYFNPIGADESGRIGEDPRGIPNNLMPYISQVAVGRLERLRVFGDDYPTPDGTGVRDYIHVTDLARGHTAAIRYVTAHRGCEVFNLGTGKGYSVLDMVRAFGRVNGTEIPYVVTDRRPGDIAVCYADPEKSRRVLSWQAEKDLEDMCRDSWNWQRHNPQGYDGPSRP